MEICKIISKYNKNKNIIPYIQNSKYLSQYNQYTFNNNLYEIITILDVSHDSKYLPVFQIKTFIESPKIFYDIVIYNSILYYNIDQLVKALMDNTFIIELNKNHKKGIKKLQKLLFTNKK